MKSVSRLESYREEDAEKEKEYALYETTVTSRANEIGTRRVDADRSNLIIREPITPRFLLRFSRVQMRHPAKTV